MHYKEYGDESADFMLLVHGGGVSGWMWDSQLDFFRGYHLLVPDLPEHGASRDGAPFSITDSAERLLALIEEKSRGKKVILIGFSLGAQIVAQMVGMKPTSIDYAIINSALAKPMPHAQKWMLPLARLTAPLVRSRLFSRLQAKTLYVNDRDLDRYFEDSRQTKPDALIRVLKENMSFRIPDGFGQSTASILVTVGEKERAVMKQSAQALAAANSNATGIVISGIGHGVSMAMPAFFNEMIDSWIREGRLPDKCRVIHD
ncbi:alpha/beta fold hydrolase [Paenibacillus sp. NPDC058071]|uniref:alpha/beta fold hydrolase n=1 Tax=Paenibacillus sp. NPDC058071 TaxID=3346326 RepID=UPI0036D9777A